MVITGQVNNNSSRNKFHLLKEVVQDKFTCCVNDLQNKT